MHPAHRYDLHLQLFESAYTMSIIGHHPQWVITTQYAPGAYLQLILQPPYVTPCFSYGGDYNKVAGDSTRLLSHKHCKVKGRQIRGN